MPKGPAAGTRPYTLWKKTAAGRLDYDSTLDEVTAQTRRLDFHATPVDATDPTSAWLTARRGALDAIQKVVGSPTTWHCEAITTCANGVYWLETVADVLMVGGGAQCD